MMIRGLLASGLAAMAVPAAAQEIWIGDAVHGVETPFTFDTGEGGLDLQAGYRFAPERALSVIGSPAPYVQAIVNTDGDTSLIAAGLSWKLGGKLYARPGIGIAVHDGPSFRLRADGQRTDLGSRVLFEPELAVGWQASPRLGVEASWVHVSHARLLNDEQNPGLDIIGVRLVVTL